jgi:regulator of RNase E activity RraA
LLQIQKAGFEEVSHAGYLVDISAFPVDSLYLSISAKLIPLLVPYAPNSPHAASSVGQPKVIGPASTLKLVARDSSTVPLPESERSTIPKGQHWVDLTNPGTVLVIEQPQGQSCAAIGGIMALRMKTKGLMGCVVDGRVRDLEELKSCGLPVSTPRCSLCVAWMSI